MVTIADKKRRVTLPKPAAFGDTFQVLPTATGFQLTHLEKRKAAASERNIAEACRAANELADVEAENREWEAFDDTRA